MTPYVALTKWYHTYATMSRVVGAEGIEPLTIRFTGEGSTIDRYGQHH